MAETTIAASVEVDFKSIKDLKVALEESEKAVNELSDEFKKAEDKYKKMIDEFGDGSKEAVAAQKQMLQMQEQLNAQTQKYTAIQDEANRRTEEYNNHVDAAAATVSALNATVGGLQGALELTGLASEETEKALSKITAALSIGDAIQNLAEFGGQIKSTFNLFKTKILESNVFMKANAAATTAATRVMQLLGVTTTATSRSVKILGAAFMSIGIGALIIAITFLIEKLMDYANQSSESEKAIEAMDKATKKLNSTLDNEIAILEALGNKEAEIYKKRQQQAENELNDLRNRYKIRSKEGKKFTEEEAARFEELKTQIRVNEINENNRLRKIREDEEKKKKDEREKIRQKQEQEYEKEKQKREQKAEQERQKAEQEEKAGADKLAEINEALIKRRMTAREIELYDLKKNYEEQKKILEAGEKSTTEATELYLKQRADIEKKYLDERLQKEKDYRELVNGIIAESEGTAGKTEAEIARQAVVDKYKKRREELEKQYPKNLTLAIALAKAEQAELDKIDEDERQKKLTKQAEQLIADAGSQEYTLKQRLEFVKQREELENQIVFENEDARTAYQKQNSDERQKISKAEAENRMMIAESFVNVLAQLDSITGKNTKQSFERSKKLQIAQALISTYLAINRTLSAFANLPIPGYAIAQAIATGVAGFIQVKKIAETKFESPAVTTPEVSGGATGTMAPIEPTLSPAVQGQALNAEAINALGNNAMRAYVLNSDIQNNSQRNAYLQRNARIG